MRHTVPTTLIALAWTLCLSGCASTDTATARRVTELEGRVADLELRNDALEQTVAELPRTPLIQWIPSLWPTPADGGVPLWIPGHHLPPTIPRVDLPRIEIPQLEVTPTDPGDCVLPLPVPLKIEIR